MCTFLVAHTFQLFFADAKKLDKFDTLCNEIPCKNREMCKQFTILEFQTTVSMAYLNIMEKIHYVTYVIEQKT